MLILTPSVFAPAVLVQRVGGTCGLGSHSSWSYCRLIPTAISSKGSLPAVPHLSLRGLFLGAKHCLLQGKWLPDASEFSYPNSLLFQHHCTLPFCLFVGDQVSHVQMPMDSLRLFPTDSNPTQERQQKPVALQAHLGTPACQDFGSVSETGQGAKRAHQLLQGQLKKEQPEEKVVLHTHCHSQYVTCLIFFLFTQSLWRSAEGLHGDLPSCANKCAIIPQQVCQAPC